MASASLGTTFDIVISYGGDPAYQAAFDAAAARWEQIITADIPDVASSPWGFIDDLLIDASVVAIDGAGQILAQAGPDDFRSGSSLPDHGIMRFDSADVAQMAANGTLTAVIMHEMGHVLGLGTLWQNLGLRNGYNYTGAHALAEYRALTGNPNATSIPLETNGGSGTAGSHWSEAVFNAELMTGYVESAGTFMPISRLTIGALEDLGYSVNYGAADPFSLPPTVDDYADSLGDGSAPFGALTINGSASGYLETRGDHDWFRVELTAGVSYTITLRGSSGAEVLHDPYLRLYDGGSNLIAFDDDSDGSLNSRLVVTVGSSGTFYLDAAGYGNTYTGAYTLAIAGPPPGGGSAGSDVLNGTEGSDTLVGLAGNDTVSGFGGNDFLYGNQDNDAVSAGSGDNTVWAGQGDDYVSAQDGSDFLWGGEGADTLFGEHGYNTIVGGSGAVDGGDLIAAGVGSDLIWGNGGNDTVAAGDGANTVIGGFGSDTLTAGAGNDFIFGNQDNDTIDAGDGANIILAGLGDDRIVSGSGNDTLYGNEGNDVMTGGTGADRYVFAAGSGFDQINGFTVFEGDRIDLQGQTFAQGTSGDGDLLLTLSSGGAIEFNGVNPETFSPGFIA